MILVLLYLLPAYIAAGWWFLNKTKPDKKGFDEALFALAKLSNKEQIRQRPRDMVEIMNTVSYITRFFVSRVIVVTKEATIETWIKNVEKHTYDIGFAHIGIVYIESQRVFFLGILGTWIPFLAKSKTGSITVLKTEYSSKADKDVDLKAE